MKKPQPWGPADATNIIRQMFNETCTLSYTVHFRERLVQRDLLISDAHYVLKHGTVFIRPEPSTQTGLFKYRIENPTPNSGARSVRLVVIPDPVSQWIKIVTIMWVDE